MNPTEQWKHPTAAGQAFLCSFPYFFLARKTQFGVLQGVNEHGVTIRLYPPFTSAPGGWTGTPPIDPHKVPFLRKVKTNVDQLFSFAAYPTFSIREGDQDVELEHWDSIRVDAVATLHEDELAKAARDFLSVFTKSLRVAARQWWIGHPHAVFVGTVRNVFSIDARGLPIDSAYGISNVRTFHGFEKPIDAKMLKAAFAAAIARRSPPLVDEILLDGVLEEARGDLPKAILEYAIACEMEKDAFFVDAWSMKENRPFRRGRALKGNNLADHLDRDMLALAASKRSAGIGASIGLTR